MLRIITGTAKGKKLKTLEGEATRPTSDRIKEAVFSAIQFDVENRRVLDLFAGSGQLGLEAMSRGAEYAMFVDASRDAMAVVKKNAEKTHFFTECGYLVSDYRSYLRKAAGRERFDIVFLDPPYRSDDLCDALVRLHEGKTVKDTGFCVCETDREEYILGNEQVMSRYEIIKNNGYGRVRIMMLRPIYEENDGGVDNE